ncbi:MAG TPA: AMP-binding protein, partial [Aquabacterium sp.]|nr:AMP-binding protein [Aquabacterium sp.]
VTISAGVPTIWLGLLNHVKQNNLRFTSFRTTIIGGAACPPAMIRSFENDYDVEVVHAWGMTELSPIGTLGRLKSKHADLSADQKQKILEKQGKSVFGIDMRIVNGEGEVLPWDGKTSGDLEVRGHWVIQSYFNVDKSPLHDGWFPTGDVATIDPDGYMQITDRSKDVIKSGGEWISSIDLENAVMAHPAVHEAAVIAAPHPKWDERPLLVVVKKPGADVTREELLSFYEGKIPRWQIPDDVVFVTEIPHTATGKIYKLGLREQFKDHKLPGV